MAKKPQPKLFGERVPSDEEPPARDSGLPMAVFSLVVATLYSLILYYGPPALGVIALLALLIWFIIRSR